MKSRKARWRLHFPLLSKLLEENVELTHRPRARKVSALASSLVYFSPRLTPYPAMCCNTYTDLPRSAQLCHSPLSCSRHLPLEEENIFHVAIVYLLHWSCCHDLVVPNQAYCGTVIELLLVRNVKRRGSKGGRVRRVPLILACFLSLDRDLMIDIRDLQLVRRWVIA